MKIISSLILSFSVLLCGFPSSATSLVTQNIINEIEGYRSGDNFGGIPKEKWPELIEKINAVRIYNHLANIAIVLSEDKNTESGIYIYQKISSARPTNSKRWNFEKAGTDIWKYTYEK